MKNKQRTFSLILSCAVVLAGAAGCKRTADTSLNYKNALDAYYEAHPVCLWGNPKKFPTQANTSDASKTAPYDALVDQGLLTRTTGEKKEMLILSKEVTNYDLSDQGRAAWSANVNQPGYGNFCYGHWTVATIDGSTPSSDQQGASTQVKYHYSLSNVPAWAAAPETQNAYPDLKTAILPDQVGVATLSNTAKGWVVTSASGASKAVQSADGAVVE